MICHYWRYDSFLWSIFLSSVILYYGNFPSKGALINQTWYYSMTYWVWVRVNFQNRDVIVRPKVGLIGNKWDKSATLRVKMFGNLILKVPGTVPFGANWPILEPYLASPVSNLGLISSVSPAVSVMPNTAEIEPNKYYLKLFYIRLMWNLVFT